MKKYFLFILSLLLILCTSCKFFRNSRVDTENGYFLNAVTGSDENAGTAAQPIKTLDELNRRLKKRAADINLAGGQIFQGTLDT